VDVQKADQKRLQVRFLQKRRMARRNLRHNPTPHYLAGQFASCPVTGRTDLDCSQATATILEGCPALASSRPMFVALSMEG